MMYKKNYFMFFLGCLSAFSAHSTDITPYADISSLYDQRRIAFKINRQSQDILKCTHDIKTKLFNSSTYDTNSATTNDHRLVLKTVIASLLIHNVTLGGIEDNDPIELREMPKVNSFQKILRSIYTISDHLHSGFMASGYTGIDLKRLQGQLALLLTCTQMSEDIVLAEFYTAIEDHYNELSFLRDRYDDRYSTDHKVSRSWLNNVFAQYSVGSEEIHRYKPMHSGYVWIKNAEGIPIAVYKPISFFHKGATKQRNIARECFSTLIAQTMGITIMNSVIPVKIDDKGYMTYSPCQSTGTLEALLGFSDADYSPCPDVPDTDFSKLIRRVCVHNRNISNQTINCTPLEKPRLYGTVPHYHILSKRHFDSLFKSNFESDEKTYFETNAIDTTNLYQIFAFRYLRDYRDMHTDNIIFIPNLKTKKLELKVIDAEYTFDYENQGLNSTIPRRIPRIYELSQAINSLMPGEMESILMAPHTHLKNIFRTYNLARTTGTHQMTQNGIRSFFFERLYWLKRKTASPMTPGRLLNYTEYQLSEDSAHNEDAFVVKKKPKSTALVIEDTTPLPTLDPPLLPPLLTSP